MNQPITRQPVAARRRRQRAELRALRAKVSELEVRLGQLQRTLAGRADRLADRVTVLERWCPFVHPRSGTRRPEEALEPGVPLPAPSGCGLRA